MAALWPNTEETSTIADAKHQEDDPALQILSSNISSTVFIIVNCGI